MDPEDGVEIGWGVGESPRRERREKVKVKVCSSTGTFSERVVSGPREETRVTWLSDCVDGDRVKRIPHIVGWDGGEEGHGG